MKILLISAGSSSFKGALWGAYGCELPLNLAYVAAYLEEHNYHTEVLDLQISTERLEKSIKRYALQDFAFVGVSANLSSYQEAYNVTTFLRDNQYQGYIFIFGPLGFYLQERIFDECPGIDFVIYGEEEPSILELIGNYVQPQNVKGICYRENGSSKKNQPGEYIENIDNLPFPAREKFDVKRYIPTPGKYYVLPQITMLSSRGCQYRCLFCPRTAGKELRLRSAENVLTEIDEIVYKYHAREIYFIDELFGANREETLKLAEALIKREYNVYLRIATRINHLDREVLTMLKKAGVYSVGIGIESGSDEILKYNNKQITKTQIREVVALLKSLGLEIRGFFMLNMPGDTRKSIEETRQFIKELDIDLVNAQIAYPYPNSAFRKLAEKQYKIIEERWNKWEYSDGDDVVFLQSDLSEEFILDTYRGIIKANFLNITFILKWLKRIKTFHDFKYSFLQFLTLFHKG